MNQDATELQTLFDAFIEECEFSNRLRPETIRGYKAVFTTFMNIMPEADIPTVVTSRVITEFFKRLQTRERKVGKVMVVTGVRDSTIKSYCVKLGCFFKWLLKKGHIKKNPFDEIKTPEPIYEDRRALEKEEVLKILAAIMLHSSNSLVLKRDLLIMHILLMCGLRRTELISLRVNDIDLSRRLLRVNGQTSKSKKTRLIPMNPTLVMYMREYFEERKKRKYTSSYLLVSYTKDKELSIHGIKQWVKKMVKLSGVKFHLHQCRHTFACNLAKMNVNAIKIQKLMGHADLRMTMVYLRSLTAEDLRGDIEKLNIDNFI